MKPEREADDHLRDHDDVPGRPRGASSTQMMPTAAPDHRDGDAGADHDVDAVFADQRPAAKLPTM